jgi:glucose/arabinose dehydrogenase
LTNREGDLVITRLRRATSEFAVDPASRFDLRWSSDERAIRHPLPGHYGGHLAFGPDGYLYIGLGDGGSSYDADNNAQNPWSPLGKMLRIDVDVPDHDGTGYRIPPDNPFIDADPLAALPEIWAFGLRNPWRYSFDDFGDDATGALLIADVGQDTREEVNYEPAGSGGRNYGWSVKEGTIALPGFAPRQPSYGPLTEPLFDYEREGRSVIGGFVYRGSALPATYRGRYFFADFVSSRIWSAGLSTAGTDSARITDVLEHTEELPLGRITAFGRDRAGELYLVSYSGSIVKITSGATALGTTTPTVTVSGRTVTVEWPFAPDAVGYELAGGTTPGSADVVFVRTATAQRSLTFHDVPPGTYYVRMRTIRTGERYTDTAEMIVVVH